MKNGFAYLTDFGIARDIASDIDLAKNPDNVMLGSPKYISPEHLKRAEITPKSDIYSLGLLIYELLTGEPPFTASELLELLQMPPAAQRATLARFTPGLTGGAQRPNITGHCEKSA